MKGFEIMFPEIREITAENKEQALQLKVAPNQQGYVETVAECLTEAREDTRYVPVALYDNQTMVGFAMYGRFVDGDNERIWFDRYLIDEHFQGQGYGKYFMKQVLAFLTEKYHCHKIYLSVYDDNTFAIHLYEKLGFHFNGELDIHGEKVMVREQATTEMPN